MVTKWNKYKKLHFSVGIVRHIMLCSCKSGLEGFEIILRSYNTERKGRIVTVCESCINQNFLNLTGELSK